MLMSHSAKVELDTIHEVLFALQCDLSTEIVQSTPEALKICQGVLQRCEHTLDTHATINRESEAFLYVLALLDEVRELIPIELRSAQEL